MNKKVKGTLIVTAVFVLAVSGPLSGLTEAAKRVLPQSNVGGIIVTL